MGMIQMIQVNIDAERSMLDKVNALYEKLLRGKIPEGDLICRTRGNNVDYFFRGHGESNKEYIKKKTPDGRKLIANLKLERFLCQYRQALQESIAVQEDFLSKYIPVSFEQVNSAMPKSYQYRFGEIMSYDGKCRVTPSENPFRPGDLKHITKFGLPVRSKSEHAIAELLYDAGVSYGYEKKLILSDKEGKVKLAYPDFTILCENGQNIYWEHKGMMDNEEYVLRDQGKMQLYRLNGIYPPKNLIITHDGADGSIDTQDMLLLIRGIIQPKI